MKKSVRIILIGGICLIIVLIPIILYNKLNKNYQNNQEIKEERLNEELKIKEDITLEVNSPLLSINDLFSKDIEVTYEIKYYLDNEEINPTSYDKIRVYDVRVLINDKTYQTKITVEDTIKPVLKLKEVSINEGEVYKIEDFIDNCTDNSGETCLFEYKNPETYSKEGTYDITIIAKDSSSNAVEETTKLNIKSKQSSPSTKANKATSNNNSSSKPKFIETKKDVTTTTEDYKYGVKINKTTTTSYDLYSDGTTKNQKTTTKTTYDYSGYQATAKDLLPEAIENRKKYAAEVIEVLDNTNKYREEVGIADLILDEDLTKVAMIRAMEMGYGNKLSHMRPNGDFCFSVADELGFGDFWGENLAWGQTSGKQAANWWRNSQGHYYNMVGNYTKLGVGVIKFNGRYLWVQVFA